MNVIQKIVDAATVVLVLGLIFMAIHAMVAPAAAHPIIKPDHVTIYKVDPTRENIPGACDLGPGPDWGALQKMLRESQPGLNGGALRA